MLKSWTINRATGFGITAALLALILWPLYGALQERILLPYVAALGVTGFCGLSILWITVADIFLHRRRGERLVPVRAFDLFVALALAAPALTALHSLLA